MITIFYTLIGDCMKKGIIIPLIIIVVICIGIGVYFLFFNKEKEPIEVEECPKVVDNFKIIVNDKELVVKIENNKTANELIDKLDEGNITIEAEEYGGFEKVGELGFKLPRADKYTVTSAGDVVLYNGDEIVLFYGTNTWNYTKIGKIDISEEELKSILGEGDITYTITK